MTINYALGLLGPNKDPLDTVGTLDLGGASTQIAFIPSGEPYHGEGAANLTLFGVPYFLYAESFLGYGVDQARFRLNASVPVQGSEHLDPCIQDGYRSPFGAGELVGTGNAAECSGMMGNLLNITDGSFIDGSSIPTLRGTFYAFSGIYHFFMVIF